MKLLWESYAVQKYLLWKRIHSVGIFILNNFFAKKVAIPKGKCLKKLPILNKWLFGWSFAPKK